MAPGIGFGVTKHLRKTGILWQTYWLTLISATVENAAPTNVVLTFPTAKPALGASDFTIAGFTISSASWTGAVLTLVLAETVVYGESLTVTFVLSGGTAAVTNNVALAAEVTTYITGLTTPLSTGQKTNLDRLVKNLKSGLSITNLSDAFDIMYVFAGETEESSLKNLVKNAHHCTNVNACTFVQYEGLNGDGISKYINSNYQPLSMGSTYALNSASIGIYKRSGTLLVAGANKSGLIGGTVIQSSGAYVRINTYSGLWWVATGGSELNGIHVLSRTASNAIAFYQNGTKYTNTQASNAIPAEYLYIGALDTGAAAANFADGQCALMFAGKSILDADEAVIRTSFEAYMDANGKGVIP